jgi:hypothetical protein
MRQTGHKSAEMLARYIRIREIFTRNAAAGLGIWPLRKRASRALASELAGTGSPAFFQNGRPGARGKRRDERFMCRT